MILTILGSSSALPTATTHPTAHLLNVNERFFLIDCGEGTQMQLRRNSIKIQRIHHIFISHLHGDHYFGLIGLLTTMQLLGREKELHIFSPKGLKPVIKIQATVSDGIKSAECDEKENASGPLKFEGFTFPVIFHEQDTEKHETIFEDDKILVETIPLKHRIPCCGFLFREKPKPRSIKKEVIDKFNLTIEQILKAKQGEDIILEDGTALHNNLLTNDPAPSHSYAFCSDTQYTESIIPIIKEVDLLYHEATFLHELEKQAKKTAHTTALQAATIAQKAHAKQLIIGHFSARYKKTDALLKEAQSVFKNTVAAEEGKRYIVGNTV